VRTDLLLRTYPPVRNRYVGRMSGLTRGITFLPSARIVTDRKGRYRVTLKSYLNDEAWRWEIRTPPGKDFDLEEAD